MYNMKRLQAFLVEGVRDEFLVDSLWKFDIKVSQASLGSNMAILISVGMSD